MATCPTCRNQYEQATFCPRDGTRLLGGAGDQVLGGRYRLIRKVGEGAMGEVYEGEHIYIRKRVAVKILRQNIASDPEAIARLQREAESISGLDHPNVVNALDFGQAEDGSWYLAMEWLEGENLDQYLRRGPVEVATALAIVAQATAGVAEAHELGIVHRDLKPANLFVTRDRRGAMVVKVLDFGIAKLAIHQTQLTGTGILVGTPNYMAPEQALGDEVDARSDVYALGVILYELLVGSVPFRADNPLAVLHQHTSRVPAPPSKVAPGRGITSEIDAIVMRCLAKKPADRFSSANELVAALGSASAAGAIAPPPPSHRPAPADTPDDLDDELLPSNRVGRARGAVLIGGMIILTVGVVVVFALSRGRDRGPSRLAATAADASSPVALGPDAATVVAVSIDAAIADAAPATVPDAGAAWTHHGHGKHFAYSGSVETSPTAGVAFDLAVRIGELEHPLDDAASLTAHVSLLYFADHHLIDDSTHLIGPDGDIVVPLTLSRAGRHHVHIELLDGDRHLDKATFDLVVR